jgi:hypothetical protein
MKKYFTEYNDKNGNFEVLKTIDSFVSIVVFKSIVEEEALAMEEEFNCDFEYTEMANYNFQQCEFDL